MNRLSLPKCHLLRASDLLEAIIKEVRPEIEAAKVTFDTNIPPNLFCEADQDQFVDSVIYVLDIVRNHVLGTDNPTLWLSAAIEDDRLNVSIQNNCLQIDRKAADTVTLSTAVDLYMEFDSEIGNMLSLSFPTSSPIDAKKADAPVELPR